MKINKGEKLAVIFWLCRGKEFIGHSLVRKGWLILWTGVFLMQASILFGAGPSISHSGHTTYVIITVDAETPSPHRIGDFPLPEQFDAEIGGVGVGISRMMNIADSFQVPITFFMDVYEYSRFGKEAIKKIVQAIDRRGHDVQLHTHPEWIGSRIYMYEYSLTEQVNIVKEGKELFKEWLGRYPVVHRTGTYAANEDTLRALKQSGIFFDSSWFYSNPFCSRLTSLNYPKNAVAERMGIVEFPVTVFQIGEWAEFLSFKLPPLFRYKKVDIDSCTLPQLLDALEQLEKNDVDVVTLFLHSWSFVKHWSNKEKDRRADMEDINDFQEVLRYISMNKNMKVITAAKFMRFYKEKKLDLSRADFVPNRFEKISFLNYVRKKIGITRQNLKYYLLVITISGGIIVIAVFVALKRSPT